MTDREKARRACHWLKTYVLGGKASIGEEANGIRRSYSVEDSVLDEIRSLCDEFARLDSQPIPEQEKEAPESLRNLPPPEPKPKSMPKKPRRK